LTSEIQVSHGGMASSFKKPSVSGESAPSNSEADQSVINSAFGRESSTATSCFVSGVDELTLSRSRKKRLNASN
jgi:hypothetical protein